MVPEVGCKNLVSRLKKVVLPAPFGPIRAWISPCRTRTETPSTATNPLKSLTRLCVSRITSSSAIAPCPLQIHGLGAPVLCTPAPVESPPIAYLTAPLMQSRPGLQGYRGRESARVSRVLRQGNDSATIRYYLSIAYVSYLIY